MVVIVILIIRGYFFNFVSLSFTSHFFCIVNLMSSFSSLLFHLLQFSFVLLHFISFFFLPFLLFSSIPSFHFFRPLSPLPFRSLHFQSVHLTLRTINPLYSTRSLHFSDFRLTPLSFHSILLVSGGPGALGLFIFLSFLFTFSTVSALVVIQSHSSVNLSCYFFVSFLPSSSFCFISFHSFLLSLFFSNSRLFK